MCIKNIDVLVIGGEDRASRLKDPGRAIFTQYERTFTHAPYLAAKAPRK